MSSPASRRSGWAPKLILLFITLALIFGVAEAFSWVVWQGRMQKLAEFGDPSKKKDRPKGQWDDLPKLKGLYVVARPNVRGTTAGVLFENNSHGFRGPERPMEKPEQSFRIAVIGDSVTMGFGVLYEDTYAARIEAPLDARRGDRRIEILNVGLSGLETPAVVDRFESLALEFDPDLVIYGYTLNDIEGKHYRSSYGGRDRNNVRFFNSPLHLWRLLGPKVYGVLDLVLAPQGSYPYELEDNYRRNPAAWKAVLGGLDELSRISQERGICSVMLIHTRLESLNFLHPYHDYYDQVRRAGEARGFFVAESYGAFARRKATDLWITAFDAHPNAEGHGLLADVLLEKLESLPADCWQGRP